MEPLLSCECECNVLQINFGPVSCCSVPRLLMLEVRSCSGLTGQRLGQGRHSKHTTVCSDSVAESYGLMEVTDLADAERVIIEQKNALQRNILHLELWSVHLDSFLLSRREVVYLTVPSCWRSWWAFLFFFSDLSGIPNEEILVNDFFASCRFLKAILEALNTSV